MFSLAHMAHGNTFQWLCIKYFDFVIKKGTKTVNLNNRLKGVKMDRNVNQSHA